MKSKKRNQNKRTHVLGSKTKRTTNICAPTKETPRFTCFTKTAVIRMRNALNQFLIYGIQTTIPFHKYVLSDENFINGNINTNFIENHKIIDKMKMNFKDNIPNLEKVAAILAGIYYENKPSDKLKSNKISNWRKYANNYGAES